MEQKSSEKQLIEKRLKNLENSLVEKSNDIKSLKRENKELQKSLNKIIKQLQINKTVNSRVLQKMKIQESLNYEIKSDISNVKSSLKTRG